MPHELIIICILPRPQLDRDLAAFAAEAHTELQRAKARREQLEAAAGEGGSICGGGGGEAPSAAALAAATKEVDCAAL